MLPLMNGLVLDVIVIVLLLSVAALGAFKGIKHIAINFALLLVSLAVSLMPFTNILKVTIIDLISPHIELKAAVASEHKLAIYMSYTFLASLMLALLLYVLMRLIKVLICFLVKKRKEKANEIATSLPSATSRVAGGIFSFIFNGLVIVLGLSIFSHPFVGGDKTTEISYVSKYVEKLPDIILDLVSDDELLEEKIVVKLLKGNVLAKVSDTDAKNFQSIATSVSKKNIIPKNLDNPQEDLDKLGSLISFAIIHMLDEKGLEVDGYELAVEMTRDLANQSVTAFNSLRDGGPCIKAEKTMAVANNLQVLGLDATAVTFKEAFEQK